MKKILTLLLVMVSMVGFSQNVGISDDASFVPTERLHIDGNLKIGDVAGDDANIYLANKLYDMDNSTYFLDPGATSRINGLDMNQGSPTSNTIYFLGDDETGIYQPSVNSIGFSINAQQAIRITSSRNLHLNNNNITGVDQLSFDAGGLIDFDNGGSISANSSDGDAGQVLKSDGTEVYWDDISDIITESVFETLTSTGEILWSHPDDVDVYIDPDDKLVRVDNGSSDDWTVYITGKSSNSTENVSSISGNIANGENAELDITGTPCSGGGTEVWINEVHYDNNGTDSNEGVEISGTAGTDLSTYTVYPYNGSNGQFYSGTTLSGTITNQSNGIGTIWFAISGLQNGAPDGLALYDGSSVIMFISYEGTFTATNGVANGMTSVSMGVSESSSTSVGNSLQLQGTGSSYSDFTWGSAIAHTRGLINTSQTITSSVCNEDGGFDINAGNNTTGEGFTIHVSFTGTKFIGVVSHW